MVLMVSQAFAMGGKGDGQKRGEHFKKELNLSDEQVEKFRELKKNRGEMKELKSKFKESKKAFREAMKKPASTPAELQSKFDAFMKLRDEFQRKRFAHMLEKRAILTPEQIVKFNEMKGKWREGKKGKKGKRSEW